jgi:hypothetical protein
MAEEWRALEGNSNAARPVEGVARSKDRPKSRSRKNQIKIVKFLLQRLTLIPHRSVGFMAITIQRTRSRAGKFRTFVDLWTRAPLPR